MASKNQTDMDYLTLKLECELMEERYNKWREIAKGNGICRRTFNYRVNKGLPFEVAATAPLSNTSPKKYKKLIVEE